MAHPEYCVNGTVCLTRPACAKRPGTGSILWVALPDPCRGVAYIEIGRIHEGVKTMTGGETAYLTMVLVLFVGFIVVIGVLSQTQKKRDN